MPLPPLPPPRPRSASNPNPDGALWQTLGAVQSDVAAVKVAIAEVKQTLASQNAGTRSQTLQLLIGGIVTCVTAVVGSRVVAPTPPPTQTVVQTSAYDRALEGCKQIQTDADRVACIVKVAHDAAGMPLR